MGTGVPDPANWRRPDRAPRPKRPAVRILKIVPQVMHRVVILSRQIEQIWTHHIDGRTRPCTGESGKCRYDHEKTSLRWQGWFCVQRVNVHEQRLMWITPTAVDSEPRLIQPGLVLRGMQLEVGRLHDSGNSPIWCKLNTDTDMARLAPDVDVLVQVHRMFDAPPRPVEKLSIKEIWERMGKQKGGGK